MITTRHRLESRPKFDPLISIEKLSNLKPLPFCLASPKASATRLVPSFSLALPGQVDLTPVAAALDPTWRLWPLGSRAEGLATEERSFSARSGGVRSVLGRFFLTPAATSYFSGWLLLAIFQVLVRFGPLEPLDKPLE